METLYRKYRPQNFNDVIGQEHIVKILRGELKSGNISHAYILIGPRGTGKTSVGRILAKAINCLDLKNGNPCGKCENCTIFQEGKSLDVVEIDAASNRSIDDIKNLKEKISFSPIKFEKKIYIIDEVHMLSKDAFNALLKTLEEPPSYVVFILATTEAQKVPLTILSRCQRFDFKLASTKELSGVLKMIIDGEKKKVTKEALELVSEMGKGSFRDSQTILQKLITNREDKEEIDLDSAYAILGLATYQNVMNLFNFLYNQDFENASLVLKNSISEGKSPTELCVQLIRFGEKCLSLKKYEKGEVFKILDLLFGLERQLKLTDYDDIAFELYAYKICNRTDQIKELPQVILEIKSEKKVGEESKVKDAKKESPLNRNNSEDLITLKKMWPELISKVKAKNIPLSGLLANSEILSIDGNILNLKMKYKFHKSRIENKKALDLILTELEELTSKKMAIIAHVTPDGEKLDLKGNNDIVGDVFSELLK